MRETSFLEISDSIGSRLCRDAIWSGERCNWLGWALDAVNNSWTLVYRAQNTNLYDGTAGIALFLGRLFSLTHDPLQKMTAIAAINQAVSGIAEMPEKIRPSVYSGAVGIGYTAIDLGLILADDGMVSQGLKIVREASQVSSDCWLDVLGGSAGTIQALLNVGSRLDAPDLVDLATAHGQLLLRTAVKSDRGWSWDTLPGQTQQHLAGYGHGAAGIGCALIELWAATHDPECLEGAREAFRYERSHFSRQHHNWPDLRSFGPSTPASQPSFAMAWCHGAPGIGLSRLRAVELIDDREVEQDLDEALQGTVDACSHVVFPASGSLCLCHGLGGNADLLLCAAESNRRSDLRQVAENIGRQAIAQLRRDDLPWPCGVNGGGETPNLMLGLAGIGHFFLRLHDPVKTPSLLLLSAFPAKTQIFNFIDRPELALAG